MRAGFSWKFVGTVATGRAAYAKYLSLLAALCLVLHILAHAAVAREAADPVAKPRPVALLIGNAAYPDDGGLHLKHPIEDARKLADELKRRGFEVLAVGQDLTRERMMSALETLYARIKPGSAVLMYYGGYGIQSGNGRSYMIPTDARIWTEADVRRDGIDIQGVLDQMNIRGAALKIAILDASRRTPWERRFRDASMGLAPVVGNKGSIIICSAAPNTVVDDEPGDGSLFMRTLLKGIQAPGLTVEEAFFKTRNEVSAASNGEEVPWVSSFVTGDVYINPPAQVGQPAVPPAAPQLPPAEPQAALQVPPAEQAATPQLLPDEPCAAAEAHWRSAEVLGTRKAYADHLARFADCQFATLALARIDLLDQADEAARKAAGQRLLGLDLAEPSDDLRARYKIKDDVRGVLITGVDGGSEAADKHLSAGNVIVEVAQEPVSSAADIRMRLDQLKKDGKKSALMLVNADGELRFVALRMQ